MRLVPFALSLLTALAHAADVDKCPDGYREYSRKGGALACMRDVQGSAYRDHHVSIHLRQPPDVVMRDLWQVILDGAVEGLYKRTFLERSERSLLFHDLMKTPIVSDREYTIRATRSDTEIRFDTANELGPPPTPKYVRIPVIRTRWIITPEGDGSRLVSTQYVEPGGSVPAFVVRGPQAKRVLADVLATKARLDARERR